jgi:hypothetical protein
MVTWELGLYSTLWHSQYLMSRKYGAHQSWMFLNVGQSRCWYHNRISKRTAKETSVRSKNRDKGKNTQRKAPKMKYWGSRWFEVNTEQSNASIYVTSTKRIAPGRLWKSDPSRFSKNTGAQWLPMLDGTVGTTRIAPGRLWKSDPSRFSKNKARKGVHVKSNVKGQSGGSVLAKVNRWRNQTLIDIIPMIKYHPAASVHLGYWSCRSCKEIMQWAHSQPKVSIATHQLVHHHWNLSLYTRRVGTSPSPPAHRRPIREQGVYRRGKGERQKNRPEWVHFPIWTCVTNHVIVTRRVLNEDGTVALWDGQVIYFMS